LANSIREFADRAVDPQIVGFLHTPETPNGQGLVLTHGAGSNAQAPLLRALADTFAGAGYTVLRCNLPYRQARSFGPPGPADAARDRAGLKNATAALRKIFGGDFPDPSSGKVFLGGHSYGGRQASMLCSEEPDLVAALRQHRQLIRRAAGTTIAPNISDLHTRHYSSGTPRSLRLDRRNRACNQNDSGEQNCSP
jgi:dienelactone hydrolase